MILHAFYSHVTARLDTLRLEHLTKGALALLADKLVF